jgi:putative aminopeptidase FrvX
MKYTHILFDLDNTLLDFSSASLKALEHIASAIQVEYNADFLDKYHKINHQVTVRRSGGTDAGGFHLSNVGVPCIVLGVPARYIHSHNGIIDLRDYQAMVELSELLVKKLSQNDVCSRLDWS